MSKTSAEILRYTLLPGFIPRLIEIFTSGFSYISYFMALIYSAIGLLPKNHPYLIHTNKGQYGIRHVISEAANQLVFSKKNIDQIIVFFTTILGLVLLIMQFVLLLISLFAQQEAMAQILSMDTLFSVNSPFAHGGAGPQQDIVFVIMDRVFGMQGIFNSCVSEPTVACTGLNNQPLPNANSGAYPAPFHLALHKLLNFYSIGIFFVAVIIILYFIITIVAETASTGTPFGQRTNKAWAPIRLILFFAMLTPLNAGGVNGGINGAQLVTLWTAKIGSNFATNAWGYFNSNLTDGQLIELDNLLASPTVPSFENAALLTFMYVAKTCKIAEEKASISKRDYPLNIEGYIVSPDSDQGLLLTATNFENAVKRTVVANGDASTKEQGIVKIVFGHYDSASDKDDALTKKYPGKVFPACGELALRVERAHEADLGGMQEIYYKLIQEMWTDAAITERANCRTQDFFVTENPVNCVLSTDYTFARESHVYYNALFKQYADEALAAAKEEVISDPDTTSLLPALRAKGWAGASLWYNRIADINGAVAGAFLNKPTIIQFPAVMETVLENQRAVSQSVTSVQAFKPELPNGKAIEYEHKEMDPIIASLLYSAYRLWNDDSLAESTFNAKSGNLLIDILNKWLGTSGIFSMRKNVSVHPLAQLSALGKSMMQASLRNLAFGGGGQNLAGFLDDPVDGATLAKIGSALWGLGLSLLILSGILYYILPFLPFVYFMFAVSGWVKSIFEAMVAMPLWAIAHLRIDGEGIPGRDASNGYFLLLEIFLRPILIVFGLLASISIFSASVNVLNDIFTVVVENVSGADAADASTAAGGEVKNFLRSPVDEIFYTAVYVILVYMMALANFKLIDLIPNKILRWAGSSVSTIQENAGDPASQITGTVFTGGTLLTGQAKSGALLPQLLG